MPEGVRSHCPHCHQEHPQGMRFCPQTGLPLDVPRAQACPHCGNHIPLGVRFCPYCARDLTRPRLPVGLIAGAGVAIVILAAVVYWFFSKPQDRRDIVTILGRATQTPTPTSTPMPTAERIGHEPTEPVSIAAEPTQPPDTPSPAPTITGTQTQTSLPTPTSTTTFAPSPTASATLTAAPTLPLSSGLIAFNSNRFGANDIFVLDLADPQRVTQLTTGSADDRVPSWSPDGSMLAYQSNEGGDYEIFTVSVDTGRINQVTRNNCNDYNPVWSPNGQAFAYYSDCDSNREIYTIGVDGSNRQQLTNTGQVYNWFPNWSPDGTRISFASNRGGSYHVYVMNADGTGLTRLAAGCVSAWSPDGGWIAFSEYCTDLGALYRIRVDGSGLTVLNEAFDNTNPSWSPDGEWIAFQSDRSGNEEIWVMDVGGDNAVQLTHNPSRDSAPVWQPGSRFSLAQEAAARMSSTSISPLDGMEMIHIPEGEFPMGSTQEDLDRMMALCPRCKEDSTRDQLPQHNVYLDAYWIDKTEVTNSQFARFVDATGYQTTADRSGSSYVIRPGLSEFAYVDGANWRHPFGPGSDLFGKEQAAVTHVSWEDANAYCQWAGRRLPTEAEWEKAARGADGRFFPWGDQLPDENLLNYNYSSLGPVQVGNFPEGASPYGLLDMAGNVWEWVADFYGENYYPSAPGENPHGPTSGEGHPFRGGSWASELDTEMVNVTTTFRLWNLPYIHSNVLGIRCASDQEGSTGP